MAYREATIEELTQIADRLRKHATTVYSVVSELKLRQQNTALVQLKLLLDHVFPRLDAPIHRAAMWPAFRRLNASVHLYRISILPQIQAVARKIFPEE